MHDYNGAETASGEQLKQRATQAIRDSYRQEGSVSTTRTVPLASWSKCERTRWDSKGTPLYDRTGQGHWKV